MQAVTDLVKLRDSIIRRVRKLRGIVSTIGDPITSADRCALAYVTIELDNLIVVGLRQYTKSSLLRSRTAAGARITATVKPQSSEEAAALIFRSLNPTGYAKRHKNALKILEKDEHVFRDPKEAEKVLIDYSASNISQLTLALSLNAQVFGEAKVCRHFFAHRAKNTQESVQRFAANLGIIKVDMTENFILKGRPGTGVPFMDGWLADIENFFDLAA